MLRKILLSLSFLSCYILTHSQIGHGVVLDGCTNYFTVPDNNMLDYNQVISIECWVMPNCEDGNRMIISKQWCQGQFAYYLSAFEGKLFWSFSNSGTCTFPNVRRTVGNPLVPGQFIHVAVVHGQSNINLFINGQLAASEQSEGFFSPILNSNEPFRIGVYKNINGSFGHYFSGMIDELRVWNIALNASLIQQRMNTPLTGNEQGLVLYFDMEETGQGVSAILNNQANTGSVLNATPVGFTSHTPYFEEVGSYNTRSFDLGPDTTLCSGSLELTVNLEHFKYIEWSNGTIDSTSIEVSNPGQYAVLLETELCKYFSDTIHVSYEALVADLGPDTTICEGDSILLDASQPGASYLWHDGSTDPSFVATMQGWHVVEVAIGECSAIDSFFLTVFPIPSPDLGPDTTICPNSTLILNAFQEGASYTWSTGETGPTIQISEAGVYSVEVNQNGCTGMDEIDIQVLAPISGINIGLDTTLCAGFVLTLNAVAENAQEFTWSNGQQGSSTTVSVSGSYFVVASNQCESVLSNSIDVIFEDCDCYFWLPNVFSPNQDGINDIFMPFSNCEALSYELNIFDRWGGHVFQSQELHKGWDGTHRGRDASVGVYAFFIEAAVMRNGTVDAIRLEGDVTLIR